jgi:hypothetical protein
MSRTGPPDQSAGGPIIDSASADTEIGSVIALRFNKEFFNKICQERSFDSVVNQSNFC